MVENNNISHGFPPDDVCRCLPEFSGVLSEIAAGTALPVGETDGSV